MGKVVGILVGAALVAVLDEQVVIPAIFNNLSSPFDWVVSIIVVIIEIYALSKLL